MPPLMKLQGRIDVRSRMGSQGITRQGERVALVVVQHEFEFDGRVTGVDRRRLRIDGRRHIDPTAGGRLRH